MDYKQCLETKLQKGNPYEFAEKRRKRIIEAISFESGSLQSPQKHKIAELGDGTEVYFLKPGKETARKKPNPYDMTPVVGDDKIRLTFQDVWDYLIKTAVANEEIFKMVGILIYRLGYMVDHEENKEGSIRYAPKTSVEACIKELDSQVGAIFPFGLNGFLSFVDILGWNEDVKYHTEDGNPIFNGKFDYKAGRINTIKSCISVPFLTWEYVKDIIVHKNEMSKIDTRRILDVMQRFSRSRGVCIPSKAELLNWLSPYLIKINK
jgi:hypothetical protein